MKTTSLIPFALPVTALLMAGFISSCKDSGDAGEASAPAASAVDPAITAVFVDTEPSAAVPVSEARKTAKAGDTITVIGKIAGAKTPFTEGFATAVLSDIALKTCELIPGDTCPTPWDACCAAPEVIKSSRLTIQVVGEDSRPIAQTLKGVNGLTELDPLVVSGTVAEGSTEENLIMNVSSLYRRTE